MSSIVVCDVCGKQIQEPNADTTMTMALIDRPTNRVLGEHGRKWDMHHKCYTAFIEWTNSIKAQASAFKDTEDISVHK